MAEAEAKYDILTHIVVGGDVWVGLHRVGWGSHWAAVHQGEGGDEQDLQGEREIINVSVSGTELGPAHFQTRNNVFIS